MRFWLQSVSRLVSVAWEEAAQKVLPLLLQLTLDVYELVKQQRWESCTCGDVALLLFDKLVVEHLTATTSPCRAFDCCSHWSCLLFTCFYRLQYSMSVVAVTPFVSQKWVGGVTDNVSSYFRHLQRSGAACVCMRMQGHDCCMGSKTAQSCSYGRCL